jgi:predicted nucleic acid-binding protein
MTGVVPTSSPYAIGEVIKNIRKNAAGQVQERRLGILLRWTVVTDDPVVDPIPTDIVLAKKDRPILAAAIASKCNYLVTSDQHDFARLYKQSIDGVYIMHTRAFAGPSSTASTSTCSRTISQKLPGGSQGD